MSVTAGREPTNSKSDDIYEEYYYDTSSSKSVKKNTSTSSSSSVSSSNSSDGGQLSYLATLSLVSTHLEDDNILMRDDTYVSFSDLEFKVADPKLGTKIILKGLTGQYRSGQLIALMGPSGAGKTSLMNILCGQNMNYTGSLTINGSPWQKEFRNEVGFAPQFNLFFPNQSVKDIMMFRATVKLPKSYTHEMKETRVLEVLDALKLRHCEKTTIGYGRQTMTGGELKKLSVALELITRPRVLILDEPTSGIDSTSAYELIDTMKVIAKQNNMIVLVSLHQPSMKLFRKFDKATFMRNGYIIYHGPAGATLNKYCKAIGRACPTGIGIADHLTNLLNDGDLESTMVNFYEKCLRYDFNGPLFYLDLKATTPYKWPDNLPQPTVLSSPTATGDLGDLSTKKANERPSKAALYRALFRRSIKAEARRCYQIADLVELTAQILVQAIIYWQTYTNRSTVDFYSHVGQIYGVSISLTFKGLFTTVYGEDIFRLPVRREIIARQYTHWHYKFIHHIAQTIIFLPWPTALFITVAATSGVPVTNGWFMGGYVGFIGSYLLGQSLGQCLCVWLPKYHNMAHWGVAIQLICLMVAGNYTTPDSIQPWLQWLIYLSYIYYAAALSLNSFIGNSGMSYDCSTLDDPICEISGPEMLKGYGISLSFWECFAYSGVMYIVLQFLSTIGMRYWRYYNPM